MNTGPNFSGPNFSNIFILSFLIESFFNVGPDDEFYKEISNAIAKDLLAMAPTFSDGYESRQLYFSKFRTQKAIICSLLIASRISNGQSVSVVSSLFNVSAQHVYRECKKHNVKPAKHKKRKCHFFTELKFIENELVGIMESEGLSSFQIDKELNKKIFKREIK